MRKFIILFLLFIFYSVAGQTINRIDNINNFIVCDITGVEKHSITYTYDTSTVWLRELGFSTDSVQIYPPDTMNVQWKGMCFLSVYQSGIEYPILQAMNDHPSFKNPAMIDLLNDTKNNGWILVRKNPPLFISFKLVKKMIAMYY